MSHKLSSLGISIAIGLAVAMPAAARAEAMFLHEGEAIPSQGIQEEFVGSMAWSNEAGGISCGVTTKVTVTTHDYDIESFSGHGCETTGLLPIFGCELTSPTAMIGTSLPWTSFAAPDGTYVKIKTKAIDNPMKPGCFFGEHINLEGEVDAIPDDPEAIGDLTVSGTVASEIGELQVSGTLDAANSGTFSLIDL